jgi:hypothetical protein|tara:strand:+ start:27 stop:182 length:156 start_codon:yes stop_codon:yes gene_type:complete
LISGIALESIMSVAASLVLAFLKIGPLALIIMMIVWAITNSCLGFASKKEC